MNITLLAALLLAAAPARAEDWRHMEPGERAIDIHQIWLQKRVDVPAKAKAVVFQGGKQAGYDYEDGRASSGYDAAKTHCKLNLKRGAASSGAVYIEGGRGLELSGYIWGGDIRVDVAGDRTVDNIECKFDKASKLTVGDVQQPFGYVDEDKTPLLLALQPEPIQAPYNASGCHTVQMEEGEGVRSMEDSESPLDLAHIGRLELGAQLDLPNRVGAVRFSGGKVQAYLYGYPFTDEKTFFKLPADALNCTFHLREGIYRENVRPRYVENGRLFQVRGVTLVSSARESAGGGATVEPLEDLEIKLWCDGAVERITCDLPSSLPSDKFNMGMLHAAFGRPGGHPRLDGIVPKPRQAKGKEKAKDVTSSIRF